MLAACAAACLGGAGRSATSAVVLCWPRNANGGSYGKRWLPSTDPAIPLAGHRLRTISRIRAQGPRCVRKALAEAGVSGAPPCWSGCAIGGSYGNRWLPSTDPAVPLANHRLCMISRIGRKGPSVLGRHRLKQVSAGCRRAGPGMPTVAHIPGNRWLPSTDPAIPSASNRLRMLPRIERKGPSALGRHRLKQLSAGCRCGGLAVPSVAHTARDGCPSTDLAIPSADRRLHTMSASGRRVLVCSEGTG